MSFYCVCLAWMALLSWWDLTQRRLPNVLTAVGYCLVAIAACYHHNFRALAMGGVWMVFYFAAGYFLGGIGGGDVKLAPSLGTLIGNAGLFPVIVAMCLAQVVTVAVGLATRQRAIAHGPAMMLAACIVLWWWPESRLIST